MATKIDKLGLVNPNDANIRDSDGDSEFPSYIKVNADVEVELKVVKSGANGTLRPKWIAKPVEKGPFTGKDLNAHTGDVMGAKVEAKFCGPQIYHVEAFLDEPINKTPNRILVQGYAPEKIVMAEWRKTKDGSNMGSTPNKFGDDVWLHLETEGLNGATLRISVYNDGIGGDDIVDSYIGKCYSGEININFKDTFRWRSSTGWWTSDSEEFYIKVQVNGKSYYINDANGKKETAKYIVFEDEITKRTTESYTSDLPVTIDENEIDLERYEPCRFKKITVKDDDEGEPITLFDEGALKIDQDQKKEFAVSEKIYFKFDKWDVTPSAQGILDGIATFLLDSPFVPVTLGAHCDARGDHAHNDPLSCRRAESSVTYLVSKGVSSTRIKSMGYGKRKPYICGEDLSEEQHRLNRRVTVEFNISGGDAQSIVFPVIVPDIRKKKKIILKVEDYKVDKCLRKELDNSHDDKVYVIERTSSGDSSPKDYPFSMVDHEVYSNLDPDTFLPLDYIWPLKPTTNDFLYHINSCRYYSNPDKATIIVKAYPDIKWEMSLYFEVGLSNYKAGNMAAGSTFAKHQEESRVAGYDRWYLNEHGKYPIGIGFGIAVEWNGGDHKRAFTDELKQKVQLFAGIIAKGANIVQQAVNFAQSAAKTTEIPVTFDIRYPKLKLAVSWFLQRDEKTNQVCVAGIFNIDFDPFIGAEIIIDIIGAAITALSYGTTGNPAAAKLINQFRGGLDKLGASVTFTGTFYGELYFKLETVHFDTINGFHLDGKATIGGKFGLEIAFKMGLELGKIKGKDNKPIIEFKAALSGDGYFGGEINIDSDNQGIFVQPVLKFSGVMVTGEIEGEVGWWKTSFKFEERVVPNDSKTLDKTYIF